MIHRLHLGLLKCEDFLQFWAATSRRVSFFFYFFWIQAGSSGLSGACGVQIWAGKSRGRQAQAPDSSELLDPTGRGRIGDHYNPI